MNLLPHVPCVHGRAQHAEPIRSTSDRRRTDFIQISSMGACTREPWGAPLRPSKSLQPRGFLESHCKHARRPSLLVTTTNPKCTSVQYSALRRPDARPPRRHDLDEVPSGRLSFRFAGGEVAMQVPALELGIRRPSRRRLRARQDGWTRNHALHAAPPLLDPSTAFRAESAGASVRVLPQGRRDTERSRRPARSITELAEPWSLGPLVKSLQALRGVSVVTAVVIAAEIGDFSRFATAPLRVDTRLPIPLWAGTERRSRHSRTREETS
jgi:hypothetical protein